MIPRRLPPSAHPLPTPSSPDAKHSPSNSATDNTVQNSAVAINAPASGSQSDARSVATGSSTSNTSMELQLRKQLGASGGKKLTRSASLNDLPAQSASTAGRSMLKRSASFHGDRTDLLKSQTLSPEQHSPVASATGQKSDTLERGESSTIKADGQEDKVETENPQVNKARFSIDESQGISHEPAEAIENGGNAEPSLLVTPQGTEEIQQEDPVRHQAEEEYLSVTNDGEPQLHLEHGIAAAPQRNSQNASAADRHRQALQNTTKADSHWAKATQMLVYANDAAASSLSFSAAALSNSSLYKRAMASGATWTASAVFSGVDHAIFSQNRSTVSLLSDAANFFAGIASMAATGLGNQSNPDQTKINYAATSSNALWAASGALVALSAIQNGRKVASKYGMSALAYTATGLQLAGGMANVAAAGVGIGSTATSNGSNSTLNKWSAGLWMAGTALGAASTIVSRMTQRRQEVAGFWRVENALESARFQNQVIEDDVG